MLRLLLTFAAGAAFGWGVLALKLLDWTAVLGLWAASAFFLVAAVGATAPRAEEWQGPGRHLRVVWKGRAR
jgi:hypothetical protein